MKGCVAQSSLSGEDKGTALKICVAHECTTNVLNMPGLENPEYTALDSNLLILSSWDSMNKATVLWGDGGGGGGREWGGRVSSKGKGYSLGHSS